MPVQTVPAAAEAHYRAEAARLILVMGLARSLWGQVDPADIAGSWLAVASRMALVVSSAQLGAATSGVDYVPRVLTELGIDTDMIGVPNPRGLVGIASDGRTLSGLLDQPAAIAGRLVERGVDPLVAVKQAGNAMDRIVQTQVQDAARVSAGVAMTAAPKVTRYARLLQVPSCSRCAVLAGRTYRAQTAFKRHPRCDCRHIPANEDVAGDLRADTKAYFDSLSPADQARVFTVAGAEAIRDGADIGQVVNARRANALYDTTGPDGVTLRATRANARRRVRLTPEAIYKIAPDRAEAIRLLRVHRYLI